MVQSVSGLEMSNPKRTSQSGLLEGPLTWLRSLKIRPHVRGKSILDFGCGYHLATLRGVRSIAGRVAGIDILFRGKEPQISADGILVYGNLADIKEKFDVITALACFEHIDQSELPGLLVELQRLVNPGGRIVGTVPRPPAKPVLEFLSYRLGIIDPTQIRDHKIYYDRNELALTVAKGGWKLLLYKSFQLGMNSLFILEPM